MDNCHSFLPLVAHLEDVDLVAIDLAGHGLSSHRSPDAAYNIWQDVAEIWEIQQQLGWQKFTLVGHSRGAMIATLFAATLDHIERLVLIDGFMPIAVAETDAPNQLALAIRDNQRFSAGKPRFYQQREEALASRIEGPLKLSAEAAACLADRGLLQSEQGFYWSADRRLRGASEFKLTSGHITAFVNACACAIDIIVRRDRAEAFQSAIAKLGVTADITLSLMPGSHHLHMDNDTVEAVADKINGILAG